MVGTINTRSLLPKLSILMLTNLTNIPADLTQETSLNGKYLKGIPTAVTDPDVNVGNADHTHTSDGDHAHAATVPSHSHSGTSSVVGSQDVATTDGVLSPFTHSHATTTDTQSPAEASIDGDHTHDTLTNDLEHRTITFYKKTNTSIGMSRKALPRKMTFFYSKTGTLPSGLLENLNYADKHFKGNATPGTEAGDNDHQHDLINHNHSVDISDHEHTISLGGTGTSAVGGQAGGVTYADGGHSHAAGSALTTGKTSTPVTSGDGDTHQHDDLSHEPSFKTLRLMEVNSVKMSNVGVPKNCVFLWLDLISLLVAGWQVSDGTNNTIDMLDVFPKGNATPDTPGGNDEHTHSEDTVSHSHTGADIGHSHSGSTGSSANASSTVTRLSGGVGAPGDHTHTPGIQDVEAAQTITITDGASNHDHGSISNEPDSKTVAFIERVN